ncbi:unnamed protein product [Amoebophrya sp. A120]|nr:unnamed protein product [Amoebophrya sp. A120]|eukprot:GSA120T00004348001.1
MFVTSSDHHHIRPVPVPHHCCQESDIRTMLPSVSGDAVRNKSLCVCNLGLLVTCNPAVAEENERQNRVKDEQAVKIEACAKADQPAIKDPLGRIQGPACLFFDEAGNLTYAGSEESCPFEFDKEADVLLDGSNLIALPGLVDCHTHAVWAGSRSAEFAERLRGVPYIDIQLRGGGINSTTRATREASLTDLYEAARKRVDCLLHTSGATTVEIKSGYGLSVDSEFKMLQVADKIKSHSAATHTGPRVVKTFLGAHLIPPEFKDLREQYVRQVISEQIPKCAPIADHCDVFVDKGAFTLEEGRRILEAGQHAGLKVKAHAEQIEHTGCAKLVAELNGLSADHLERLDEDAAEWMGKRKTVATLLPGAQWYLRDISPPVDLLRKHSVTMAVSTDLNPGSSPVYDLMQCATMSCVMQGLTPEEAILGITRNAGMALGDSRLGHLTATKQGDTSGEDSLPTSVADVAFFRPPPGEGCTIESLIQFSGGYKCVGAIRDGKFLFRDTTSGDLRSLDQGNSYSMQSQNINTSPSLADDQRATAFSNSKM